MPHQIWTGGETRSCACRQPDGHGLMIQCDEDIGCGLWKHRRCANLPTKEVRRLGDSAEVSICAECEQELDAWFDEVSTGDNDKGDARGHNTPDPDIMRHPQSSGRGALQSSQLGVDLDTVNDHDDLLSVVYTSAPPSVGGDQEMSEAEEREVSDPDALITGTAGPTEGSEPEHRQMDDAEGLGRENVGQEGSDRDGDDESEYAAGMGILDQMEGGFVPSSEESASGGSSSHGTTTDDGFSD